MHICRCCGQPIAEDAAGGGGTAIAAENARHEDAHARGAARGTQILRVDGDVLAVCNAAFETAQRSGSAHVEIAHLALAMAHSATGSALLAREGWSAAEFAVRAERWLARWAQRSGDGGVARTSSELKQVLNAAQKIANGRGTDYAALGDVLTALHDGVLTQWSAAFLDIGGAAAPGAAERPGTSYDPVATHAAPARQFGERTGSVEDDYAWLLARTHRQGVVDGEGAARTHTSSSHRIDEEPPAAAQAAAFALARGQKHDEAQPAVHVGAGERDRLMQALLERLDAQERAVVQRLDMQQRMITEMAEAFARAMHEVARARVEAPSAFGDRPRAQRPTAGTANGDAGADTNAEKAAAAASSSFSFSSPSSSSAASSSPASSAPPSSSSPGRARSRQRWRRRSWSQWRRRPHRNSGDGVRAWTKREEAGESDDGMGFESEGTQREGLEYGEANAREKRFYLALDDDIEKAPSIGPRTAETMRRAGVHTVRELLTCDPAAAAAATGVRHITANRIAQWQTQARLVCTIPWLRGTHAQLLAGAGYDTVEKIVSADTASVCAAILTFAATREGQSVLRSSNPPGEEWVALRLEHAKAAEPGRAAAA